MEGREVEPTKMLDDATPRERGNEEGQLSSWERLTDAGGTIRDAVTGCRDTQCEREKMRGGGS